VVSVAELGYERELAYCSLKLEDSSLQNGGALKRSDLNEKGGEYSPPYLS
jgi:hypothetical protein